MTAPESVSKSIKIFHHGLSSANKSSGKNMVLRLSAARVIGEGRAETAHQRLLAVGYFGLQGSQLSYLHH